MKKEIIVISILILLISTATIIPVANSSTASILINKSGKIDEVIDMDYSPHDEEIEQLYEQFKHKIYSKHDPLMEANKLLSYPEIQDEIKELSDRNTFQTINMLFSNSNPLIKKVEILKYNTILTLKCKNETIQKFDNTLRNLVQRKVDSVEDIFRISSELNLNISSQNISMLYAHCENYLQQNLRLSSALSNISKDIAKLILIAVLLLWGFFLTGTAVAFPDLLPMLVKYFEVISVGVIVGATVEAILTLWCGKTNHTILNQIINGINNSSIIPPGLASFLANMLGSLPSLIMAPGVRGGVSSLFGIIAAGTLAYLWDMSLLTQFIGGGLFYLLVAVPIIVLIELIDQASGDESPTEMLYHTIGQRSN